jgi:hypothetical protein
MRHASCPTSDVPPIFLIVPKITTAITSCHDGAGSEYSLYSPGCEDHTEQGRPRVCPSLRDMLLRDITMARFSSGVLLVSVVRRLGMLIPCPMPKSNRRDYHPRTARHVKDEKQRRTVEYECYRHQGAATEWAENHPAL